MNLILATPFFIVHDSIVKIVGNNYTWDVARLEKGIKKYELLGECF